MGSDGNIRLGALTYDVSEDADLSSELVYRGPDITGGMEGHNSHCEYPRASAGGGRGRRR